MLLSSLIRQADFACWILPQGISLFLSLGFYASNNHAVRPNLFWWIEPFLTSGWTVSAGDRNTIPDLDRIGEISGANNLDVKPFRDFIGKFDLSNKYRNENP